mgnify:CR=1 FL=1|jgi:hypothetical protein
MPSISEIGKEVIMGVQTMLTAELPGKPSGWHCYFAGEFQPRWYITIESCLAVAVYYYTVSCIYLGNVQILVV